MIAAVAVWLVLAAIILTTWPRSRAWRAGLPLVAVAFALLQQLIFATVPDRAFVTFRYAGNIAAGNGAVFNIGERHEDYSNFAWLVLVTLPKALFGADVVRGAVVLSVACALGCVLLAHRFGPLAGVLTAAASGLAAYECAGTETPLFVLLVLAVLYAVLTRHPVAAGVLAALAMMTRPDGLALAIAAALWLATTAARRRSNWWAPGGYVLALLVVAVPWLAWRATYYDQPLLTWPATEMSVTAYAFLLAALFAVVVTRLLARHRRPSPVPRRSSRWVPVAALVLCGLSLPVAANERATVLGWRDRLAQTAEIGSWLAARLPAGAVISTGAAALAYGVGYHMVVLTGDQHNEARDDDDVEYVATLRRPALVTGSSLGYGTAQKCVAGPDVAGSYEVATFHREGYDEWVTVYPRDDEAAGLIRRLDGDPRLAYVPCPG
ncbi:MAG TPA: hypothetical protein VHC18_27435 [Amycolatopsis sp.]|nr:hypothetical protein [Amycolatopsis sp.]